MADEAPPKPEAAKSAAPVQEGAVGAASEAQMDQGLEEAQIDQTEGVPDKDPDVDVGTRLAQLFDHLKIAKVVFVDDKAELQTDAGTIYKVVVETPGASEALAAFFPGVGLTIDNEALLDQLDVRLAQLDADGSEALRAALASLGGDAAEREAGGLLKDALPEAVATTLLTPQLWHERRAELIAECTDDRRTLFLFDQELEVQDGSLGFTKGSEIIRDMAEKDKAGFGSRWFCGILTHTVSKGDEVSSWRGLAQAENLGLELFMPIAKATLDDAPAFCAAVYRTLINTYCETMKSLAQEAFSSALKEALERFADLDPIDFEHMVIKSSEEEGVSELATLIRLYGIIHTDQVKAKILQKAHVNEFSAAARTANGIADIGRTLSPNSQERLHKLRHDELYEGIVFRNQDEPSNRRLGRRTALGIDLTGRRWALQLNESAEPGDANVVTGVAIRTDGRPFLLRQGRLRPSAGEVEVTKEQFRARTGAVPVWVSNGDTQVKRDWYVVTALDVPADQIRRSTAAFVELCLLARDRTPATDPEKQQIIETLFGADERGGSYRVSGRPATEDREVARAQGDVWEAMAAMLALKGLKLTKPRPARRYEVDGVLVHGEVRLLIEIKCSNDAADIYTGSGQLLIYQKLMPSLADHTLVLLLPRRPPLVMASAVEALGITIATYELTPTGKRVKVTFPEATKAICGLTA